MLSQKILKCVRRNLDACSYPGSKEWKPAIKFREYMSDKEWFHHSCHRMLPMIKTIRISHEAYVCVCTLSPKLTFAKISFDKQPTMLRAPSFSLPLRSSGAVSKYFVSKSLVNAKMFMNVCFRRCLAISIKRLLACICAEWKSSRGSTWCYLACLNCLTSRRYHLPIFLWTNSTGSSDHS